MLPEATLHLLDWLRGHATLGPIVARLGATDPTLRATLQTTHNEWANRKRYTPPKIQIGNREHHAAVSLAMLERISTRDSTSENDLENLVLDMTTHLHGAEIPKRDNLGIFRKDAVDVLFEYLDEHLDDRIAVHGLIEKFRQRSEHYDSTRLREVGGRDGEIGLARNLQLYLLDQSVDFVVEATSRSGQPDLVLRDSNRRYVVLDAKYIRPDASRSKIVKTISEGFHQVAGYCQDLGEPYGHIVVFNESDKELRIGLEEMDGLRYQVVGGKQVIFVELKLGALPPASKAGKAHEVSISADELVIAVSDEDISLPDMEP